MNDKFLPNRFSSADRRKFIANALYAAGGLALLSLPEIVTASALSGDKQYTVQQVIDVILKEGNLAPITDTVDTIKAGKPDQIVTGIVTTMFASINVIEAAIKLSANFIIAHEPTFYNHRDDTAWVANNEVVKKKQALLEKNNIAVWRFHDYCHSLKPDAVSYGVAKKAGWLDHYKMGEAVMNIPSLTLLQLVQHLKLKLDITHVRVIGNLDQACARIAVMPGSGGGQRQVTVAETYKPDVLIVGELSEWETAEYIRDERLLGGNVSLIILGHGVSEDPGMEWLVEWLKPKLSGVNISHVPSGDPFIWL